MVDEHVLHSIWRPPSAPKDNLMSGKTEPEFFDLRLPQHVHRRGGIPELVGDSPNLETWFGRQSSLCP